MSTFSDWVHRDLSDIPKSKNQIIALIDIIKRALALDCFNSQVAGWTWVKCGCGSLQGNDADGNDHGADSGSDDDGDDDAAVDDNEDDDDADDDRNNMTDRPGG